MGMNSRGHTIYIQKEDGSWATLGDAISVEPVTTGGLIVGVSVGYRVFDSIQEFAIQPKQESFKGKAQNIRGHR